MGKFLRSLENLPLERVTDHAILLKEGAELVSSRPY